MEDLKKVLDNIVETLEKRATKYGDYEVKAYVIESIMDHIRRLDSKKDDKFKNLSYVQLETFHMVIHKMARLAGGDAKHLDTIDDMIGYLLLLRKEMMSED